MGVQALHLHDSFCTGSASQATVWPTVICKAYGVGDKSLNFFRVDGGARMAATHVSRRRQNLFDWMMVGFHSAEMLHLSEGWVVALGSRKLGDED